MRLYVETGKNQNKKYDKATLYVRREQLNIELVFGRGEKVYEARQEIWDVAPHHLPQNNFMVEFRPTVFR